VIAEISIDSLHTGNEQRDAHVKAADFLDAEKYPTASFVSTGVRSAGDNYVLDGQFTAVQQAIGTPKSRDAAAKYLRAFVEEVKASGLVAEAISKNAVKGVSVAPPASAQK